MNTFRTYAFIAGISLLLAACVQTPEEFTSPTNGTMDIVSDITLREIIEEEESIFEKIYKYAHLNITYAAELDMFEKFLQDSIRNIITTRRLTADEKDFLSQRASNPREFAFATSAIAFIQHKAMPDTAYTYERLLDMMKDPEAGMRFIVENPRSGIALELMDLLGIETLPTHFFALNAKEEVIEYVTQHENAIGIIDYTDIADSDSPYTKMVLDAVTLIALSRPADSTQVGFVQPFQYNLQDRQYPFTRDLYYISKTGQTDVGLDLPPSLPGRSARKSF